MKKENAWYLKNPCDSCVHNDGNKIEDKPCAICIFACFPFFFDYYDNNCYEYKEGAALVWD